MTDRSTRRPAPHERIRFCAPRHDSDKIDGLHVTGQNVADRCLNKRLREVADDGHCIRRHTSAARNDDGRVDPGLGDDQGLRFAERLSGWTDPFVSVGSHASRCGRGQRDGRLQAVEHTIRSPVDDDLGRIRESHEICRILHLCHLAQPPFDALAAGADAAGITACRRRGVLRKRFRHRNSREPVRYDLLERLVPDRVSASVRHGERFLPELDRPLDLRERDLVRQRGVESVLIHIPS